MKMFPAKYNGVCKACGLPFFAGEMITRKNGGWGHAECPSVEEFGERLVRWILEDEKKMRTWRSIRKQSATFDEFFDHIGKDLPEWAKNFITDASENVRNEMVAQAMVDAAREHLGREITVADLDDFFTYDEISEALREAGVSLRDVRKRARDERKRVRAELEEVGRAAIERASRMYWDEK